MFYQVPANEADEVDNKGRKAVNSFPLLSLERVPTSSLAFRCGRQRPSALTGQPSPPSISLPIGSAPLSCLFKEIFLEQYTHIQTPITQSPSKYGDDGSVALWFPSNSTGREAAAGAGCPAPLCVEGICAFHFCCL